MQWHMLAANDVAHETKTNVTAGLTATEAEKRLRQFGYNELAEGKQHRQLLSFSASFKILWCSFCCWRPSFRHF